MDDILHTAVHAFLRVSQVSLKPSCHIVHQHLAAVGAEEKMVMGRFKTKDNLDNMTKAAAKETGLETRFTLFTVSLTMKKMFPSSLIFGMVSLPWPELVQDTLKQLRN